MLLRNEVKILPVSDFYIYNAISNYEVSAYHVYNRETTFRCFATTTHQIESK